MIYRQEKGWKLPQALHKMWRPILILLASVKNLFAVSMTYKIIFNTNSTNLQLYIFVENYVPFLSTVPRKNKLKNYVDVMYDPPHMKSKIKVNTFYSFLNNYKLLLLF